MKAKPKTYPVALPNEATVFGDELAAKKVADAYAKGKKTVYLLEASPAQPHLGVPAGTIIRVFPVGASPISADRKFLRVSISRPKKRVTQ